MFSELLWCSPLCAHARGSGQNPPRQPTLETLRWRGMRPPHSSGNQFFFSLSPNYNTSNLSFPPPSPLLLQSFTFEISLQRRNLLLESSCLGFDSDLRITLFLTTEARFLLVRRHSLPCQHLPSPRGIFYLPKSTVPLSETTANMSVVGKLAPIPLPCFKIADLQSARPGTFHSC